MMAAQSNRGIWNHGTMCDPKKSGVKKVAYDNRTFGYDYLYYSKKENQWYTADGDKVAKTSFSWGMLSR